MAKRRRKRKKRQTPKRKEAQQTTSVAPRALQLIQRKLGGRQPDRAKVRRAFLQEARRELQKAEHQTALDLANQALRLAQSEDERRECRSLLAEIHFARGMSSTGKSRLSDLKKAVELAPEQPTYRLHLAYSLERQGKSDKALPHYEAASNLLGDGGVGYLWSLAALEAGRPLPSVELTPAEQNTLNLVRRLVTGDTQSVQVSGPLLDGSPPLWQALIRMVADETATPIKALKAAAKTLKGTDAAGIVHYYLGVAALRAGDLNTAWEALTSAQKAGYSSPWLEENHKRLARALTLQRAEEGDWQAVVKIGEPLLHKENDRVLAETVGLAHFHLGYEAAQTGNWAAAVHHWQHARQYHDSRYLAQNLAVALEQQEDWAGAAEAWRDMIRRRPRKKDHPDYLDENQIAALWHHAAECYKRVGNAGEAIICLRNALKYKPDDAEIRRAVSEALVANEQFEAAENELKRLLDKDPDNVEALVQLAYLYSADSWWRSERKVVETLERVLELDPEHREARDLLATHYVEQGRRYANWGLYDRAIEHYRQGLERLPDSARLYMYLAMAERHQGDEAEAREHLLKACELDPEDVSTVGAVLHELLHLDAEEDVERLLPKVRQIEGLLPGFWISQGEQALGCHLGLEWVERFFEEALDLAGRPWVTETKAEILVDIFLNVADVKGDARKLRRKYQQRIAKEVPKSGAKELIDALVALLEAHNWNQAERLLRKARNKASKAGEEGLLDKIEATEALLYTGPLGIYEALEELFGEELWR